MTIVSPSTGLGKTRVLRGGNRAGHRPGNQIQFTLRSGRCKTAPFFSPSSASDPPTLQKIARQHSPYKKRWEWTERAPTAWEWRSPTLPRTGRVGPRRPAGRPGNTNRRTWDDPVPGLAAPQSAEVSRPSYLKFQTGEEQVYGPEASDLLHPWPQWPLFLVRPSRFGMHVGTSTPLLCTLDPAAMACRIRGALSHLAASQACTDQV